VMFVSIASAILLASCWSCKVNGFVLEHFRAPGYSLSAATEPIDPLFNDTPPPRKQRRVSAPGLKKKANARSKGNTSKVELSDAEIDKVLLQFEAQLLNFLPLEFSQLFDMYLNKLVPKVSAMALIIHIMMLIPLLKLVVINQLQQGIANYLYLGPITIALPFLILKLFEKEVYDSPIVKDLCFSFISAQQARAKETLEKNRAYWYGVLEEVIIGSKEDEEEDILRNVASARLLAKVDVEILTREVLCLKRMTLNSDDKDKPIIEKDPESRFNNGTAYLDAALLLIKKMKIQNPDKSDKDILMELKAILETLESKDNDDRRA
jgi:hypothetical protein